MVGNGENPLNRVAGKRKQEILFIQPTIWAQKLAFCKRINLKMKDLHPTQQEDAGEGGPCTP
jgi:hypothetical protein